MNSLTISLKLLLLPARRSWGLAEITSVWTRRHKHEQLLNHVDWLRFLSTLAPSPGIGFTLAKQRKDACRVAHFSEGSTPKQNAFTIEKAVTWPRRQLKDTRFDEERDLCQTQRPANEMSKGSTYD
ncbi:hypothetical protein PoB_002867800 [Plakobranchus ocellatus]|uniref:Uncharacterized protein n=1 Tax=Plakobranchus ocellatus TaxID=259542 RepID=A0AAV4A6A4_9GAST|nr:hypothetical protein PoB_002867800 [Plakobranchus ocellatus]